METATLTSPLTRNGHRADSSFQAIQTETNHRAPIEESNRKEPRLKPIAITVLAALAAAAFAFAAHHWWVVGRFIESTDDAYINGDVTVIAPKVAGFVESISVKDNQQVNAGDLLLKLDGRDYAAALAKSEASVAFQKASLTNLDATGLLQQAMVLQARASVTAADAETARAGNDQARAEENFGARGRCLSRNAIRPMPTIKRQPPRVKKRKRRSHCHATAIGSRQHRETKKPKRLSSRPSPNGRWRV